MPSSDQVGARTAVVIVAAGLSTRMQREDAPPAGSKAMLELSGRSVLEHCAAAFDAAPSVVELVLVVRASEREAVERLCAERAAFAKVRAVVLGGETRAQSVANGVRWCAYELPLIAVHDAARPLVDPAAIERATALAAEKGAALVALPVRDTLKRAPDGTSARETVDRRELWAAQTPQVFEARILRRVLAQAAEEGFEATDEASVWERYVGPVPLVAGTSSNFKITTPDDLELAQAVLEARARRRTP
jgi:2-C-methyl-D-erythritol 4-phosphate cytidylyltransferase